MAPVRKTENLNPHFQFLNRAFCQRRRSGRTVRDTSRPDTAQVSAAALGIGFPIAFTGQQPVSVTNRSASGRNLGDLVFSFLNLRHRSQGLPALRPGAAEHTGPAAPGGQPAQRALQETSTSGTWTATPTTRPSGGTTFTCLPNAFFAECDRLSADFVLEASIKGGANVNMGNLFGALWPLPRVRGRFGHQNCTGQMPPPARQSSHSPADVSIL